MLEIKSYIDEDNFCVNHLDIMKIID